VLQKIYLKLNDAVHNTTKNRDFDVCFCAVSETAFIF